MGHKREMEQDDKCGKTLQRNSKQICHFTNQMFWIFNSNTALNRGFQVFHNIVWYLNCIQLVAAHVVACLVNLDKN